MSSQEDTVHLPDKPINHRERWLIAAWAAGLLTMYVVGGGLGIRQLQTYRVQTEAAREERLRAVTADAGAVASRARTATQGAGVDVLAGLHVRRIGGFSLKDAEWTADFDIWFRWSGEAIHPGETFEVINGDIQRRDKVESYVRNGRNYERYRVTARMIKHFDSARFPFAEEGLIIEIQNSSHETTLVHYVADQEGSGLAPDALTQNVKLQRALLVVTAYQPGGGAAFSGGSEALRPRLVFAMLITPVSFSFYLVMFQALFTSVAVAMIVFFIRPIYVDARFGLSVGAFFAAVANNIFVATLLPREGRVTLAAMANTVSLATIFLILVASAISLHLQGTLGRDRLSIVFDKISFVVMSVCYVSLNVLLPWAAMPR